MTPKMKTHPEHALIMNLTNATGQFSIFLEEDYIMPFIIPLTIIYVFIFVAGVLGNTITCLVIAKNRSMHTSTNFYLFSLAVSDLLLLLFGLPLELQKLWFPNTYPFSESMCIATGLISETSANATVLTITAVTVERYIAICHPFTCHTTSQLSRAVRFIFLNWLLALCTAVPQVAQFGIVTYVENGQTISVCTVKGVGVHQLFVISSFIFFVIPMSTISVMYVLIGIKLRTLRILHPIKTFSVDSLEQAKQIKYRNGMSQRRVIRMLIVVALSFCFCWAPFHIQRVIAIYGKGLEDPSDGFCTFYVIFTFLSGVLYFLSTAINPFLYNIMSNKFRNAFKMTLASWCEERPNMDRSYSALLASRRRQADARATERSRARRLRHFALATTELYDAPPRAQCYSERDVPAVFASTSEHGHWSEGWRYGLNLHTDSIETPHSISNTSLREVDDEVTGEELATYMYQTNCHIKEGLT